MTTKNITVKDRMKMIDEFDRTIMSAYEDVDFGDVKSKSVSIRLGNKVFDLVPSKKTAEIDETSIREELERSYIQKLQASNEYIQNKINDLRLYVKETINEYELKTRKLNEALGKTSIMPEVTISHAQRGLSIVKGDDGKIIWLVRRTYNPRFIDNKPIEPTYVKKLMTNIILRVVTKDNNVLSVSTHSMHTLDYFEHYHQAHPDCWGTWTRPATWKDADDILRIADDAMAILANINTMSIARRMPRALPRLDTLRRHVMNTHITEETQNVRVSTVGIREGLGAMGDDSWGN